MTRPPDNWLRRPWTRGGLYLGFWTCLGLANTTQSYLQKSASGRPFLFPETLAMGLADWYVWAALTPLIFYLTRRFRFGQGQWPVSIPVHLCANLFAATTIAAVLTPIIRHLECGVAPELGGRTYLQWFRFIFVGYVVSYTWIYWSLVAFCYAIDNYQKYRDRELRASQLEAELARAELLVLKMQLHPHFLFNTLHAISALMHQDVRLADRMLARLAELLRSTLDNAGTQEVTLRSELEFVRPYLEIEQARLGTRLAVDFQIDPETLDAQIPNLILQPLVENAVRHGIAPHNRPGRIQVRATRQGAQLCLEVRDNGPGLPPPGTVSLRTGVGLSNTRARLRHLYGDAHQFEIGNAPGGGTLVRLTLPFREILPDEAPPASRPIEIAC